MIDLASLVPAILQHNDTVPEEWSQGRTAYGGLLGAIGMAALREVVPADRQPRSLFVQFLGPIPPGQNFDVVTEILSSGSPSRSKGGPLFCRWSLMLWPASPWLR